MKCQDITKIHRTFCTASKWHLTVAGVFVQVQNQKSQKQIFSNWVTSMYIPNLGFFVLWLLILCLCLGDWLVKSNHLRFRNVKYIAGKIIHRAIFSPKIWSYLPWSSEELLAIKVRERKDPRFFKGKKPGSDRVKERVSSYYHTSCLQVSST
mgnify:CR=1 FL=1